MLSQTKPAPKSNLGQLLFDGPCGLALSSFDPIARSFAWLPITGRGLFEASPQSEGWDSSLWGHKIDWGLVSYLASNSESQPNLPNFAESGSKVVGVGFPSTQTGLHKLSDPQKVTKFRWVEWTPSNCTEAI